MLCRYVFVIGWATTGIYTYRHTLSLHDALPICDLDCQEVHQPWSAVPGSYPGRQYRPDESRGQVRISSRSEEHTSELQSLMRISYAVFCLKKKKTKNKQTNHNNTIQRKKKHKRYTINIIINSS